MKSDLVARTERLKVEAIEDLEEMISTAPASPKAFSLTRSAGPVDAFNCARALIDEIKRHLTIQDDSPAG